MPQDEQNLNTTTYTTGEIAKLCGVSVRTVQYYDARGIFVPSALSEGGRRLYSDEDLKKMKVICFLREMGLSINSIHMLLSSPEPGTVISLLLSEQTQQLRGEVEERQKKLEMLERMKRELKGMECVSIESIGDIAYLMDNRKKRRRMLALMLAVGVPESLTEIAVIAVGIKTGNWVPLVVWLVIDLLFGIWLSQFYYRRTAYICPQCHEIFKPQFREVFWAQHTPKTRKLHCTCCNYHGFCVETYDEKK